MAEANHQAGSGASLELEAFLPYRLSVLSNTVSSRIARTYSERFGLTIPQWRILAVLGRHGGLTANDVAERTAMDKVMVSRAVAALLKSGRLVRRPHPDDGRAASLALSPKGRAIYDEIVPLALGIEARLLEFLSEADARALDRALSKLSEAARSL